MKAVDYLKEKARMTNNCEYDYCTQECPLNSRRNGTKKPCKEFETGNPEKAVEIVEKWAKENPVKTYKDVLMEKFPNAELYDKNTTPTVCLTRIFGEKHRTNYRNCEEITCKECWNREYKEEEQ